MVEAIVSIISFKQLFFEKFKDFFKKFCWPINSLFAGTGLSSLTFRDFSFVNFERFILSQMF